METANAKLEVKCRRIQQNKDNSDTRMLEFQQLFIEKVNPAV